MKVPARAPAAVALLAGVACSGSAEPAATLSEVAPKVAYNDAAVAVKIMGTPFRPAYALDTASGNAAVQPLAFTAFLVPWAKDAPRAPVDALVWNSTVELLGEIPPRLAAGVYDVELRDPRGNVATLG